MIRKNSHSSDCLTGNIPFFLKPEGKDYLWGGSRLNDDFSKGMNWENAQWVRSINRRYGSEVKPIKQAVQDFNTWQDNMNNIRTQVGGSAIIDNDDLTVYDFYGGKKPKLKFADGDKIAKKA